MATKIVNLAPTPNATGMLLGDYFRFALRETVSQVDPTTIVVELMYARGHYEGDDLPEYDEQLAEAGSNSFVAAFSDAGPTAIPASQAVGRAATGSLSMVRTLAGAHRGAQFIASTLVRTPLAVEFDLDVGLWSYGAEAYLNDARYVGVCGGSVYGPGKTGVFIFLLDDVGTPKVIISGPDDGTGTRPGSVEIPYDWTVNTTYKVVWDPAYRNRVDVYARPAATPDAEATLLHSFTYSALSSFIEGVAFGGTPFGPSADVVEELLGFVNLDSSSLGDGLTLDALRVFEYGRSSVVNGVLRASSETLFFPSDLVVADTTKPPREALLPWNEALVTGSADSDGTRMSVVKDVDTDDGLSAAYVYRDEPSFSLSNGCVAYFKFEGLDETHVGSAATGMALYLDDGVDRLTLALLDDFANKYLGVYQSGSGYQLAAYELSDPIDWSQVTGIKMIADPGVGLIHVYALGNDEDEIIEASLGTLAVSGGNAEVGFGLPDVFAGRPLFGELAVSRLEYSLNVQAYDARSLSLPPAATPAWSQASVGPGSIALSGDFLEIIDGGFLDNGGGAQVEHLPIPLLGSTTGVTVEARFRVASWIDESGAAGLYTVILSTFGIDDGTDFLAPYFISASSGRYVVIPKSTSDLTDVDGLVEQGLAAPIDFEQVHTYRLEKRPRQHIRLFIDDSDTPAIDIPWDNGFDIRLASLFGSGVTFGSLDTDTGGTSYWQRVWVMVGDGVDVAVRPVVDVDDRGKVFDSVAEIVIQAKGV